MVQDASGAILIRAGSEMGRLRRGQLVELTGTRSTKSGMVSLRVTQRPWSWGRRPSRLPSGGRPAASGRRTRRWLVVVRGLVRDGPRRTTRRRTHVHAQRRERSGPRLRLPAHRDHRTERSRRRLGGAARRGRSADDRGRAERRLPALAARPSRRDRDRRRTAAGSGTRAGGERGPDHDPQAVAVPAAVGTAHPAHPRRQRGAPGRPDDQAVRIGRQRHHRCRAIPAPLAAGLGGLAGLLILAWRHGTLRRAMAELELRTATIWRPEERRRRGGRAVYFRSVSEPTRRRFAAHRVAPCTTSPSSGASWRSTSSWSATPAGWRRWPLASTAWRSSAATARSRPPPGVYRGMRLSAMSTGMGPDNTEIVVAEVLEITDQPTFVRVGSSGATAAGHRPGRPRGLDRRGAAGEHDRLLRPPRLPRHRPPRRRLGPRGGLPAAGVCVPRGHHGHGARFFRSAGKGDAHAPGSLS